MPNIHVNVDDFLSECSSWEIQKLVRALIADGHITIKDIKEDVAGAGYDENAYQKAIGKLDGKWNRLSREEEEIILKIANRF